MHDNSFHYAVGPTSGNRWRPRAVVQGKQTAEEHAAAVVTRCATAGVNVTAAQVAAVITASDEETIAQARRAWIVDYPGGYSRMLPTAGSSHADPNFEGTFENLGPNASRFLTRAGQSLFAEDFVSSLEGVAAEKAATIARVLNLANGTENQYKVNKGQLVEGADLAGVGAEYPGSTILYINVEDATTTAVPFENIVQREPSRLSWIVPDPLAGPQMLKVTALFSGVRLWLMVRELLQLASRT